MTMAAEMNAIRFQYQSFAEQNLKAMEDESWFNFPAWDALADRGLWRIAVPVRHGGTGRSWHHFCAAIEGLSSGSEDLGFLTSIVAHAGLVRAIIKHGTQEQIDRFLPQLLSGDIGATAITETTGGSDVARISLSARKTTPGRYSLAGGKSHITNAPIAHLALIVGRLRDLEYGRDITLFLVDLTSQKVRRGGAENTLGIRSSPMGDIMLDDVELENINILGTAGDGLATLYDVISLDRLLYAVIASGSTRRILKESMSYAEKRVAFHKPICEHQYIQRMLTNMVIDMELSGNIASAALQSLIDEEPNANMLCSMAKLVGTEGFFRTAQSYMMIHGHSGYEEGRMARSFRDVAGMRIAGGTSDMQRVNIFNQLQKLMKGDVNELANRSLEHSRSSGFEGSPGLRVGE